MRKRLVSTLATLAIAATAASPAAAVNVVIDYTYDSGNFFGSGNPSGAVAGAQARQSIESVATYFTEILTDTLDSIQTPPDYSSSVFNGVATWEWEMTFENPTTGSAITLLNQSIPADEYRIYVGGRSIPGSTLGEGGPGGWGWRTGGNGGGFTQEEVDEIDVITGAFSDDVEQRGEPVGEFAVWGGAVTFDNDSSTNWHYDSESEPSGNVSDFLSVAYHEVGHALGFGTSNEWFNLASGGSFSGSASQAANGGTPPATNGGHWQFNTMSTVFGTTETQEAALDPDVTNGTRKLWTTLDAAALTDIGWDVVPPEVPTLAGDYNDDNIVDAADYTIWRDSVGTGNVIGSYAEWKADYGKTLGSGASSGSQSIVPEPAALWLLFATLAVAAVSRRGV